MKSISKFLSMLMFTLVTSSLFAATSGLSFAFTALFMGGGSFMAPDAAALNGPKTDVEAIAKGASLYDKMFISQTLNSLDIAKDCKVHKRVSSNGLLLPKLVVENGIRRLNTDVQTRAGEHRTLDGRKLFVFPGMKIVRMIPEELRESFLDEMEGLDPNAPQIPFAKWVWQQEFDKLKSEINDAAYLNRRATAPVWSAAGPYTAGLYVTFGAEFNIYRVVTTTLAGESPDTHPAKFAKEDNLTICDGLGTIIAKEIADSNLTAIVTGAIDASNALDKFEIIYNAIPVAQRAQGGEFLVSPTVYQHYIKNERAVFQYTSAPGSMDGIKYVEGSGKKFIIKECTWMGTSGRVIVNIKQNLRMGTFAEDGFNRIGKVVEDLHGTNAAIKFLLGFQIADLEVLHVNNQA